MCECNGALERRISLQELSDFIHRIAPDIEVVIGNNLCRHNELNQLLDVKRLHPTVIAACNTLNTNTQFWQDIDTTNSGPYFTKVVDILSELSSEFSDTEVFDRMKLIISSQISKAVSCSDISQDNLKLSFSLSHGDISRRSLVTSLLPRYEVIPAISQDDCIGKSCSLCIALCPFKTISTSENGLIIDKSSCTGCGACVNACPRGAISYPGYSTFELEQEIASLLANQAELSYRILAFHCQSCAQSVGDGLKYVSPSIFNIKVPSLAVISPLLLLNAFNMGADGIVFIHNAKFCTSRTSEQHLYNTISFTQQLLERWETGRNRIGYIDGSEINSELAQFADKITALGHTPFKAAAGSMTFEGMYSLASIIKEMDAKLHVSRESVLSGAEVPFGVVNIEEKRCSGCGVCAQNCPSGAISARISSDPYTFKLTFDHAKCIACGICANICPEGCLEVDRSLDLAELNNPEQILLENEFVCCRNCNKPYATKSMIEVLKHKLGNERTFSNDWTEYCPACRIAIQQKR